MTTAEAEALYKQLFIVFPGYREWLKKTGSPNETFDAWCGLLRGVSQSAGAMAVDKLIEGELAMPPAYERDQLGIMLKSYAARIDQDEQKRRATEEHRDSRLRASGARKVAEYKLTLRKGLEMMQELGRNLRDGKITREEHDAEKQRILKLAMEKTPINHDPIYTNDYQP